MLVCTHVCVCLCGGDLDLEYSGDFNPEQFESLRYLISTLMDKYPQATIHAHREFANKACPSFNVDEVLSEKS